MDDIYKIDRYSDRVFIKWFHKIVFYLPVDRYKKKYIIYMKSLFKNICGNSIFVE